MNAVEIEEAVTALAEARFDAEALPFAFPPAFCNRETTLKRLREGGFLSGRDVSNVRRIMGETPP